MMCLLMAYARRGMIMLAWRATGVVRPRCMFCGRCGGPRQFDLECARLLAPEVMCRSRQPAWSMCSQWGTTQTSMHRKQVLHRGRTLGCAQVVCGGGAQADAGLSRTRLVACCASLMGQIATGGCNAPRGRASPVVIASSAVREFVSHGAQRCCLIGMVDCPPRTRVSGAKPDQRDVRCGDSSPLLPLCHHNG